MSERLSDPSAEDGFELSALVNNGDDGGGRAYRAVRRPPLMATIFGIR